MSQRSDKILKAIQDSGRSYGELSHLTGISKSALQRYATGETKKIPIDCIELIAKNTGVTAAWLMGWEEKTSADMSMGVDLDTIEFAASSEKQLRPDQARDVIQALLQKADELKQIAEKININDDEV